MSDKWELLKAYILGMHNASEATNSKAHLALICKIIKKIDALEKEENAWREKFSGNASVTTPEN
jgi:hypothetical protein